MKTVKDQIQSEIDAKAQKIREKRKSAAAVKTVESLAFEFFKQADEAKKVATAENRGNWINLSVLKEAHKHLEGRIQTLYDSRAKVEVMWDNGDAPLPGNILGVKIFWSTRYIISHKVEPVLYIGVEQMLLS